MTNILKQKAQAKIDEHKSELIEISRRIFDNPETKFREYNAAAWICEALQKWGFRVEKGIANLDTAFRATHMHKAPGPVVAFLAEYDALPELGHACGHNLIAGAALGALLAFQGIKNELAGRVMLLGTPGEEGGAGKVIMLEAGVFQGINAALIFHPSSFTAMNPTTLAMTEVSVTFHGKSAHAAESPEKGINALQAVILTFNAINALRERIRSDARIHGVITDGGVKPSITPETAAAAFMVRAKNRTYCDQLVEKLRRCAEGAALACGAMMTLQKLGHRKPIITNEELSAAFGKNWSESGGRIEEGKGGAFSTDMGHVSHVVPSIHPILSIGAPDTPLHSRKFALAANSDRGYSTMINAAKALAGTAIDFLTDENLRKRVEVFARSKATGSLAEQEEVSDGCLAPIGRQTAGKHGSNGVIMQTMHKGGAKMMTKKGGAKK